MRIHDLSPMKGAKKKRKRVGRGPGSGHGKTSCRGHKGQKARSGGSLRPGFEGGQMPLHRRLPKRGFTNIFKEEYALIHVGDLERFSPDTELDLEVLRSAGLVKRAKKAVKLLGDGEITHPLTVKVNKTSKSAREKIKAVGGRVEIV
jgi:large subunit ribosomal protein L15